MNPNCVEAITKYAEKAFNRKITKSELNAMDDNLRYHRKELAAEYFDAGKPATGQAFELELAKRVGDQLQAKHLAEARAANLQVIKLAKQKTMLDLYVKNGGVGYEFMRDSLLTNYDTVRGKAQSTETAAKVIEQQAWSILKPLDDLEEGIIDGLFGNKAGQDMVVREMKGQSTGDAKAKAAADSIKKLMDFIYQQKVAAGADIGRIENYIPQKQSIDKLRQAGMRQWVDFAKERIDLDTIRNFDGSRVTPDKLTTWLEEAWQTMAHDGEATARDTVKGQWSTQSRNLQHRQLHWKSADAYIEMMDKFGDGSLIEQIAEHVNHSAREIVLMKKFGPNYIKGYEQLREMARQTDHDLGRFKDSTVLGDKYKSLDKMMGALTGIGREQGPHRKTQRFLDEINTFVVGSLLGSLPFAQIVDNGLVMANNIATGVSNARWLNYKAMTYATPSERAKMASITKAIFDPQMQTVSRFMDNSSAAGVLGKTGNLLVNVTGANLLTKLHRTMYRDFQHILLSERIYQSEWDAVDAPTRTRFEAAGITKADWDILRASQKDADTGAVTVDNVHALTNDQVAKFIPERINEITQTAADVIQRLQESNMKEEGWVNNRTVKLQERKAKVQNLIDKYEATRNKAIDKKYDAIAGALDVMEMRIQKAELELELQNMTGDFDASIKASEGLGVRVTQLNERIKQRMKDIEKAKATATKEVFKKATEYEKRIDAATKELEEFTKEIETKASRREQLILDYQKQVGKKIDEAVLEAKEEAISKMLGFSLNEAEIAVLQPSLSSQLILQPARGTIPGMVGQMFRTLKGYPVAMVNQIILQRMLAAGTGKLSAGQRTKNMMALMAFTSVLGGISLMLGDVAKGKDPRRIWDDEDPKVALKFMIASIIKGGGGGIIADLVLQDSDGRDVVGSFLGPVPQRAMKAADLVKTGVQAAVGIEEAQKSVSKKAVNVVTQWNPLASNLYGRALVQKYFTDALKQAADPDYYNRQERTDEKNGRPSWVGIGPDDPMRMPNFGNVVGKN